MSVAPACTFSYTADHAHLVDFPVNDCDQYSMRCRGVYRPRAGRSAWDKEPHAEARLIAGSMIKAPGASFLRAGVEIKLDPGWKTYWRQPGDSGVPPTFDFSSSQNVNSVKVLWPAPESFPDGAGGNSIGYVGHIVLPLRVSPKDAAKPSTVHLKLNYAICGNLCVPAEAILELALNGDGAEEARLKKPTCACRVRSHSAPVRICPFAPSSRAWRRTQPCRRRGRGTERRRGRTVCRGTDAGLVSAAARTERRRRGSAPFYLRS